MTAARSQTTEESITLGERAYRSIKESILRCELEPSQEVSEGQLAALYEVGKAPIRNALHRLSQEGLVESLPRRGYKVAPITIRDVKEIFEVRLVLEPSAARLAAGRVDGDEIKQLEAELAVRYEPGDRRSEAHFLEANRRFHVAIAASTGNRRLAAILKSILEENDRILHLGLAMRDRTQQLQHEHQELIDALISGDGSTAEKVARDAIVGAEEMVMDALLASPSLLSVELGATHR